MMNFYYADEIYGQYNTKTFSEIFPDFATFQSQFAFWVPVADILTEATSLKTIYVLLYARYGSSPIANMIDENQFIAEVMSRIFQYGPSWETKFKIQQEVRNWNEETITTGAEEVYNQALNPSQVLSDEKEKILTVNQQNVNFRKKDKMNSYAMWMSLIEDDFTESFLSKFKNLFKKFLSPIGTVDYITNRQEDPTDD